MGLMPTRLTTLSALFVEVETADAHRRRQPEGAGGRLRRPAERVLRSGEEAGSGG